MYGQLDEVEKILDEEAALFCQYFDITEQGNWEGKNILRIRKLLKEFSAQHKISIPVLKSIIQNGKKKLLKERSSRVRPLLDDKVILGWNALMNSACSKAFMATGKSEYKQTAVDNMQFILEKFRIGDSNEFNHTWKNDIARYPAFLDDYVFLIQALIHLQEITADTKWLIKAKELTEFVIDNFSEPETPFFFFTSASQRDVIVRKKEIFDGAIPSGNSVMAYNLYQLSMYFDKKEWKERSMDMISSIGQAVYQHPTSFGNWASLLQEITSGTYEVAILWK